MEKKYAEFGEIIKTMKDNNYNYNRDNILKAYNSRKKGKKYSLTDHVEAMVFSLLSNQRPWNTIETNRSNIKKIFKDFDVEYIKKTDYQVFIDEICTLRCGNRQIHNQMKYLKDNIETLERIEKDFGSVDSYFNNTDIRILLKDLSRGKYKLKQMDVPLVCEYLKNVGVDLVKPDVHICRILKRLGYTESDKISNNEVINICSDIAKEYNMPLAEVDTILWQYCADNYFEICCNEPKCSICLVKNCKYRQLNK